ncbi:MAG: outer membrane beta-barrel protein, partial [Gammaproteobacteria bacterium]|nr:outer membrane beta-barrel protein [Gammaproteobacteria bacterium]
FYKFNKKWKSRLKYEYRDSLYNDFNEADNIVREETLASSSVQLKYRLQKNWWLVSDFRYSDNDSNIARYSYTRNVTRIGISGSF